MTVVTVVLLMMAVIELMMVSSWSLLFTPSSSAAVSCTCYVASCPAEVLHASNSVK